MNLRIHSIRFKNFLQVGNSWANFPLGKYGQLLIIGKNGTGKSTLLDALCFALYNKPYRKITKPQIPNSINKKECLVEIAFSVGGDTYVVRRGIKPNIFEIYKDKVLIPQPAKADDYQEQLEQILGQNYKTFCQVNILGSANYTPFMELDAADRRKVVEDLLDSQIYSVMGSLAKNEAKQITYQRDQLHNELAVLEHKIETQKKLIERQQDDLQLRIDEVQSDIDSVVSRMNSFQAEAIDPLTEKITTAKKVLDGWPLDIQALESTKTKFYVQLTSNRQLIEDLQREAQEVIGDVCSACLQTIDQSHKDKIAQDRSERINKLTAESDVLVKRYTKIIEEQEKYSKAKAIYDELHSEYEVVSYTYKQHEIRLETLNKQLEKLKNTELPSVDAEELDRLNEGLSQTTEQYNEASKQLDILKNCVDLLKDDGIKAAIVERYIPLINDRINEFLEKLDLFVQFELDSQFKETIKARYKDTFSYQSFSQGQKLRIDLAILFTWRHIAQLRNSVSSNLLIMDEILDRSLDDEGVEAFLDELKRLTDVQNTVIISHKQSVVEGFSDVIITETKGNFTEYRVFDGT